MPPAHRVYSACGWFVVLNCLEPDLDVVLQLHVVGKEHGAPQGKQLGQNRRIAPESTINDVIWRISAVCLSLKTHLMKVTFRLLKRRPAL